MFDFDFFVLFFSKLLRLFLKVTKVTTGHQEWQQKNGPKQHNKLSFLARKAQKASAEAQG